MPTKRTTKRKSTKKQAAKLNPALKRLAVLAGDWEMELSNSAFLPNPEDTVKGFVSFQWVEDGAFLLMRQGDRPPSPPAAIWLMNRDESTEEYRVFYFDARGVSRIYNMSFDGSSWKMWREAPGFSQRFEGRVSRDHRTIRAHWEKSVDGSAWEHDFDMTYRRIK